MLSGASDNLFDRGLENESSVSRIERFAVPKIDFILRWAELVVTCEHTDVKLIEHSHQVQESSLRVDQSASCVNPTGSCERTLVNAVFGYIRNVELELWPADRLQTKSVVFGDDFAKHHAR